MLEYLTSNGKWTYGWFESVILPKTFLLLKAKQILKTKVYGVLIIVGFLADYITSTFFLNLLHKMFRQNYKMIVFIGPVTFSYALVIVTLKCKIKGYEQTTVWLLFLIKKSDRWTNLFLASKLKNTAVYSSSNCQTKAKHSEIHFTSNQQSIICFIVIFFFHRNKQFFNVWKS